MPGRGRGHMSEVDSDLHILNERLLQYAAVGMDNTIDVAQNIAEYCSDDASLKQKTQDIMKDFIGMEDEVKQYIAALNHTKDMGTRSGEALNLLDTFKTKLGELQRDSQEDYRAHPKYKDMEERMMDDGNIDEQLASLKASLDTSLGDDDIAMTQVEINTKCPFTYLVMVNPMRNKICGHRYDKDGILTHIRSRKDKAKCPVAGCANTKPIVNQDLEEDRNMKKYISLMAKKQSQQSQR